jgi:hypothetical protein
MPPQAITITLASSVNVSPVAPTRQVTLRASPFPSDPMFVTNATVTRLIA